MNIQYTTHIHKDLHSNYNQMVNIPFYVVKSLGVLGLILSNIYKIPQLYQIYKTKKADDISHSSIFIQTSSYIVWLTYSIAVDDKIYITANVLSLVQNTITHLMKHHYKKLQEVNYTPVPVIDVVDVVDVNHVSFATV